MIHNRRLSDNTYCLRTERPDVKIRAGQCFSVGTRDLGINREYSMYSAAEDDFIDFLVREVPDGIISPRLAGCKPGDLVEIGGPYGDFCLNESTVVADSYVFIATGTGIAPFHSFVQTYPALKYQIFHGIRRENEKYDEDHYKVGSYIPSISQPEGGLVGERLTSRLQSTELDTQSLYYLCGNRMMITDAIFILRGKGIPGSSIFTETFF